METANFQRALARKSNEMPNDVQRGNDRQPPHSRGGHFYLAKQTGHFYFAVTQFLSIRARKNRLNLVIAMQNQLMCNVGQCSDLILGAGGPPWLSQRA